MYRLPATATAPFCPSEVQGSVPVPRGGPLSRRLLRFAGPGLLISVGYMDPGNWATDLEAGSRFGFELLSVVVLAGLAAIALQSLSVRLGIASGKDLARLSRERFSRGTNLALWAMAEVGIIACDLAEVLGGALAFHLLLGCPLLVGVALTALDTVLVLSLQGAGFRRVEAFVMALVAVIGLCFAVELVLVRPPWPAVARGLVPSGATLRDPAAWYVAVGMVGATVMPHNLYLHSSIVQTRKLASDSDKPSALRLAAVDTVGSLLLALLVNAAILVLAGTAFHGAGRPQAIEIESAYHLLDPVVGARFAGGLFALALLASGQSSTFTGTIAGQVILEGCLELKIPCWQRRLLTRGLALLPAFLGVWWLGGGAVGKLLVLSQVVLSFQLPFAIAPLLILAADPGVMGAFAVRGAVRAASWVLFAVIASANLWLLVQLL